MRRRRRDCADAEDMRIQMAVGVLMGQHNIGPEDAFEQLHDAARRADVSVAASVDRVVEQATHGEHETEG